MCNQDNQYREEVDIDPRVHRRLIGQGGKNIKRIMDEYKVDIRFPRQGDDSVVLIAGDEDNVLDAKDHLLNLAEEYVSARVETLSPPRLTSRTYRQHRGLTTTAYSGSQYSIYHGLPY